MNISMSTNKLSMRILFLVVLCMSVISTPVQHLFAQQQYPVQIQPSVSFPSTFLNDYADPANTSVRVHLADLTKQNYTINIRVQLTSTNVSYSSIRGINLTLDGGEVYFLNANELSRLFALTDLNSTSSTGNNEPNSLPEGAYSLALQAFDVTLLPTLVPVSNIRTDFTIFNVVRYDQPLLNVPTNKQEFDLQKTNQNIFFNWTPRHIVYSSNQRIQYRFRLIRVIPVDRNPYDAVNTSLAGATGNIDVTDLDFPAFSYSPADLKLEPGAVYAWQVQAYEMINGQKSTSRFKNQGYSEVFTFSVKEHCEQITLETPIVTGSSVKFNWNSGISSEYKEYEFNYRKVGSSTGWIPISTLLNTITLDNTVLETGASYEYNVRARCNNWLLPVQGGNFTLATPTCVAPTPLTVNTSGTATVLSWPLAKSVDSLKLYYKITGSNETYKTLGLNATDIQCSLPLLTAGGYTIHLDALCGTEQSAGAENSFAFNESGIVGPCPIPLPVQLIASRVKGDTASLKWNTVSGAHTGSSITYWHKDSTTVTYSLNALTTNTGAGVSGRRVYDDQVYSYQITYQCGTKTQTTPIGMFRILSAAARVAIDPQTANCFPPVDIRAEARDSVSARVEWDKISGADSYELSYRIKGTTGIFTTFNTTAISTMLKPLVANAQYQLLVRVKCNGLFSIYSDTALLDLTVARNRNCDTIRYFKALKKTVGNIQVAWDYDSTNTGYIIKYREEAQPIATEYTQAFTNIDSLKQNNLVLPDTFKYTFQNLKAGTKYMFRIQKICGQNNALFNSPLIVSTLPDTKSSGACGSGNMCDKNPKDKLQSLKKLDTIYCADYMVLVDSVTTATSNPSLGLYSGLGHMEMPVPGLGDFVNMHVSFRNVKINAKPNSCVYDGTINIDSMNASIIPIKIRDSIKAIMAKAEEVIDQANEVLNQIQTGIDDAQAATQDGIDYFQGGEGVGNVKTGGLGETEVNAKIPKTTRTATVGTNSVTIDGNTIPVVSVPVLIKDSDGQVFQVSPAGVVTYVGVYNTDFAKDTTLDLSAQIVTYEEATGATYDFDKREATYSVSTQIDREYEKIGTTYYVPSKFIIPGALDKVTATLSGSSIDPAKVLFANGKGFVYEKGTAQGNSFTLNVAGGPASDGQYIYAWYVEGDKKKAIGKLLLPSYAPQVKKVVLVPVKGNQVFNPATYETYLNQTYQKLGITYQVTVDNTFRTKTDWSTDGNLTVQSSASGLLNNDYQGKEKAIVQSYVTFKGGASSLDANTAYFMAVYEPSLIKDGSTTLLGKMPAEEQFGFLYTGSFPATGSAQDEGLKRTMAHELGHGAYNMEHTFNAIYLRETSKYNTTNLMDYAAGNQLWKFQWDIIHAPGHVWGILKRDRDAQAATVSNLEILYTNFKNEDGSLTFLTPSGKPITIKEKVKQVKFITDDDNWFRIGANGSSTETDKVIPFGTLSEFVIDNNTTAGIIYKARVNLTDMNFLGYLKEGSNTYYDEPLSYKKQYINVITGVPCLKSSRFIYNVFPTNFLEDVANKPILDAVQSINKGDGPCQQELFLQNYLSEANNGKEVYAVIDGAEIFKDVFMQTRLDTKGDVCGKDAIYAFKCAMLFNSSDQGLINCLDEAEDVVAQSLNNGYREMVSNSYVPRPVAAVSTSVYNAALDKADQVANDKFAKDHFFEHLYPVLKDLVDVIDNKTPVNTISDEDIDDIVDFFIIKDKNGEMNIAGRLCILSNLNFDLRKKIIERIKTITWTDDKEKLMVDIISTAPYDQGVSMLQFLADNQYHWFEKIYDEVHLSHRDQFVYSVSYMALRHWDKKNISQTMPPDYDASNRIGVNSTKYIYVCSNETPSYCDAYVLGVEREVSPIEYELVGDLLPLIDYKVKFEYSFDQFFAKDYECVVDPFEFVKVSFLSEFDFPAITNSNGNNRIMPNELVEVPAFWLYYILKEQETIDDLFAIRVIVDAAIIATAQVEAIPVEQVIFAGVDLAVAVYVDKLSDHDAFATQLNDTWNIFSLGVGTAFITKSIVNGTVKFVFKPQELNKHVANLHLNGTTTQKNVFVSQTADLLISLAKFSTQNGIDKARNIFYTTILNAYIDVKAFSYVKNLNTSITQLVKNKNQLILKSSNIETQIGTLSEIETTGALVLSSTRWLPANTTVVSTVGDLENITYIEDGTNLSKVGNLEYVKVANGQFYLRPAITIGTTWAATFPKLATQISSWQSLELTYQNTDDYVQIFSKNGAEIATVTKDGVNEIIEISEDLIRASGNNIIQIDGLTTITSEGDNVIGAGFVKNIDGSISFVENATSYGSSIVQNTIKHRGDLRGTLNGIQQNEDAHHLFPVQSLKENKYVKKGVEGGFEFNEAEFNGLEVIKYVKATGIGRHGPHPKLTKQITDHMDWWAEQTVNGVKNKNLSAEKTAEYMRVLAEDIKETIVTTTTKLNDLDLQLYHF